MIAPAHTVFFVPSNLKKFKLNLFNRIGEHILALGGKVVRGDVAQLNAYSDQGLIPIIGCSPELTDSIISWRNRNREFVYWDRGYARRVFASWLPRGENGGYYRWHRNRFQLGKLRDVPGDRWKAMQTQVVPWQRGGGHIVIAAPTPTYARFHRIESWISDVGNALSELTDRELVIRFKPTKRPLQEDLRGAHCLVSHGSIAAVESVILGCPVFVDPASAAALVGHTDLKHIEQPKYPDRDQWLNSLAYSHFNEAELVDGTLWRHLA